MKLIAEAGGSFLVTPSSSLLAIYLACLVGGMVTAAKGRWGWLFVGLLVGGLIWPLTALLTATPESIWARAAIARARRRLA